MKMNYLMVVVSVLILQSTIYAQETQQGFIIQKGEKVVLLIDVNDSAYNSKPTTLKGMPYPNLFDSNPMDPALQKKMERSVFTAEVIMRHMHVGTPNAYCKVDTAGNIVAVSFKLFTPDVSPEELVMFAAYREQLKNEVDYIVSFPNGMATAGYLSANFIMFSYKQFSHENPNGFRLDCHEIYVDQDVTMIHCDCDDKNHTVYRNLSARDESGKQLEGTLSFRFSAQGELSEIEQSIFTPQQQQLLSSFNTRVTFIVSAQSGKVAAMNFQFPRVTDPSLIDLEALGQFRDRVKNVMLYEQILYDGKKAASGYLIHRLRMFSPERKTDYFISNLRDHTILNGRNFLIME